MSRIGRQPITVPAGVTLAIEPEPYCFLEMTDATVAYFGAPEASFVTGPHIGVSGGMAMI